MDTPRFAHSVITSLWKYTKPFIEKPPASPDEWSQLVSGLSELRHNVLGEDPKEYEEKLFCGLAADLTEFVRASAADPQAERYFD
jgi:hypothetical protein